MAPIQLFGRQWRMGSDDLVIPATIELLIRMSWVVVVGAVLIFHVIETETLMCLGEEYTETTYYLCITLGLLVTTCLHIALLASQSARGSISDSRPRHWVEPLLYVNVFLTAAELLWTIVGTFFTVHDYQSCINQDRARTVIVAVLVVIGLSYVLILFKILTVVLSFRPSESTAHALNYRSLRCIMPCTRDEGKVQAFRDIANLLGKIMHEPSLVPSDLVVGLLMLHYKHREPSKEAQGLTQPQTQLQEVRVDTLLEVGGVSVTKVQGPSLSPNSIGLEVMGEADISWDRVKHYYQYAAAAYGYWWYMMQAPCAHSCSLGAYLNCAPWLCCLRRRVEYLVQGDGFLHCNTAAMRAMLDIPPSDIIAVDNRNAIQQVPFFMVVDRSSRSLVISIRGTLSLADMLTDLRGEPAVMAQCCDNTQLDGCWKGHEGMCRAASYVDKRLHQEDSLLCCALEQTNYKSIVVTGHSLGAGTAALLAFSLRAKYPDIKVTCYAYSPPGGLLCQESAKESEAFTVSVVVGDDVIPRTSLHNIVALTQSITHICRQCQLPKHKLVGYGLIGFCCGPHVDLAAEVSRLFPGCNSVPATPPTPTSTSPTLSPTPTDQEDRRDSEAGLLTQGRPSLLAPHPLSVVDDMLPPGRILHITRKQEGGYNVAEVPKTSFDEILISTRMLADHMPNYLSQVFDSFSHPPHIAPIQT